MHFNRVAVLDPLAAVTAGGVTLPGFWCFAIAYIAAMFALTSELHETARPMLGKSVKVNVAKIHFTGRRRLGEHNQGVRVGWRRPAWLRTQRLARGELTVELIDRGLELEQIFRIR